MASPFFDHTPRHLSYFKTHGPKSQLLNNSPFDNSSLEWHSIFSTNSFMSVSIFPSSSLYPSSSSSSSSLLLPLIPHQVTVAKQSWFKSESSGSNQSWLLYLIELPLYLPRRLTIQAITEERWSKPFAVAFITLSPILLTILLNSHAKQNITVFIFASLLVLLLGITAMECTKNSHPPKKLQLPWLIFGFLMSVVWIYITPGELVSLLFSIEEILGVKASVLGVTVLTWGNSIGDLVANVAMAVNGGEEGAQVAVAGCYAGLIFNTLVGLGLSFVVSSAKAYSSPFVIVSKDCSEFVMIGFLIGGLLWALVMLPMKRMKLNRVLFAIYSCFICLRIFASLEILKFGVSSNV